MALCDIAHCGVADLSTRELIMPRYRFPTNEGNRHYPQQPSLNVLDQGELVVTGEGQVVIENGGVVPNRALRICSPDGAFVAWKESEPPCPPCNPNYPDELSWDVVERVTGGGKKKHTKVFLRIKWRVACTRTITWVIYSVK